MDALVALPDRFSAGTAVVYRRSLADYPASEACTLSLFLAGPAAASFDAVADGDDFVVTLPADETAPLPAGDYLWEERAAIADGDPVWVAGGSVTVDPDLAAATGASLQSAEEIELGAVRARILEITTSGVQSYQQGGDAVGHPELPALYARERELLRRRSRRHDSSLMTVVPMRLLRLGGH